MTRGAKPGTGPCALIGGRKFSSSTSRRQRRIAISRRGWWLLQITAVADFDAGLHNCQAEADPTRGTLPRGSATKTARTRHQVLFWKPGGRDRKRIANDRTISHSSWPRSRSGRQPSVAGPMTQCPKSYVSANSATDASASCLRPQRLTPPIRVFCESSLSVRCRILI
jgi:hypothetical protein